MKTRLLLLLLAMLTTLAASAGAYADDGPALSACKAQYLQLGPAGFAARYGASEPYRACVQQQGGTAQQPPSQAGSDTSSPAVAACKAQYLQLGPAGFAARYGASEPYRACVRQQGGTAQQPPSTGGKTGDDKRSGFVAGVASGLCAADYKQLGADAFTARYGSGESAKKGCLTAKAAQAKTIVSRCEASSGSAQAAFERCIKQALGLPTAGGGGDKGSSGQDAATYAAGSLCAAEANANGREAFVAKYGKEGSKACLQAALANARAIVESCKKAGAAEAVKRCVSDAIKRARGD